MNKVGTILYRIVVLALLIIMCFIEYHSIRNIHGMSESLKPIVIIIGIIIFTLAIIRLKKSLAKLNKKQKRLLAISICILSFIGMTVFGYCFKSMPGSDLNSVINEKNIMQENGGKFETEVYYGRYPHQTPITILVYIFSQIGNILEIQNIMIIINTLFMAITGYFIYLIVSKVKEEDSAVTTLIFYALNPITYLYASYYYTDTICFPFAIIPIYLYISSIQAQNKKIKYCYLILAGIILTLGYKIRAVVAIILIAILVGEFLSSKVLKEKIKTSSTILGGFLLGILMCTLITNQFQPINNKDLKFPPTHWIMMGTNIKANAGFNDSDFYYTKNAGNYGEKVKANIEKIKANIVDLGPSGLVNLIKLKLSRTWSNGGYDYEYKLYNLENTNIFYEYVLGNKKILLTYLLQICKALLYLMFIFAIIKEIKQPSNMKFLFISVFGFVLFYILWESLLRYSLSCMPWIMLTFPMGIEFVEKILNKLNSINHIEKFTKCFYILIVIVSVAILASNFKKYCITQNTYYDKVAMQQNSRRTIEDISNKVIEQEFVASRKFNSIELKFVNKGGLEQNNYYLEIINSKGEVLNKQQFPTDSIQDEDFKIFTFDYIVPNGEEKYVIKIYAENQNVENSSIGIGKYEYEETRTYDIYPQGDLKVNGEIQKGQDITFKVEDTSVRSKFSKKVYFLVSIFIIFIEIYALYPYIKK